MSEEIDLKVAKEVMGWKEIGPTSGAPDVWYYIDAESQYVTRIDTYCPTTNLSQAFKAAEIAEVFDWATLRKVYDNQDKEITWWEVGYEDSDWGGEWVCEFRADTPEMVLCSAALKEKGPEA